MVVVFKSLLALFTSLVVLLIGHGLQLTLSPIYADQLGWSTDLIGYVGSAYFAGLIIGCLTIPKLVSRVGHVRVFTVLTASATSALLVLGLSEAFVVWLIAKSVTGWAISGLYMVIESWVNEQTTRENRGFVLSVYTVLTLVAIGIGQLLVVDGQDFRAMIIAGAILLALGALPVGLSRSSNPAPIPTVGFKLKAVYDASHVAVIGAFVGGTVTAGFWALGPLVAKALSVEQIGTFMAVTLLGGVLMQMPVGRLSDHYDRRLVIAGLALLGALVCTGAAFTGSENSMATYFCMFLFGGATFPIYSICLAQANDNTELPMIEVGSVILIMNSLGAVVGPILIAKAMGFSSAGLFIVSAIVLGIFAGWVLLRTSLHKISRKYFKPFRDIPKTSHEVIEISEHGADYDGVVEESSGVNR